MGLLSLNRVSLRYGDRVLLDAADLSVEAGDRMSLIGRNGCGKTTLLKIMAGAVLPDSGLVERARNLSVAYLPQEVPTGLRGSVYAVLAAGLGEAGRLAALRRENAAAAESEMGGAGLGDSDVWAADVKILETADRLELDPSLDVSEASAGLRRRALLGAGLVSDPGLLLLDEPTNHLDITSREALEEALSGYDGTIFIVSHDRYFINRMATRILRLTGEGCRSFPGNYDDYQEKYQEASAPVAASAPVRENTYKQRKEQEAAKRRLATRVRRLEEEIAGTEAAIEKIHEQLADGDISADYARVLELTSLLEENNRLLEQKMTEWEETQLALEKE